MRRRSTLEERLSQLSRAVELADGVVPDAELAPARALLDRAGQRGARAPGVTVAALLGATGSGKSSLFNAVAGEPIAAVHARRPTTLRPVAAVWEAPGAADLLDWLEVPERHERTGEAALRGLVLLDLPDIDSTATTNRAIARRLAERVDVLVWVLDPEKYADGVVHEEYLRPLHEHAAVSLVVLNQADRLSAEELAAVDRHLRRILASDGLPDLPVLIASARTGQGVDQLRARLGDHAAAARAAQDRLAADVRTVAADLQAPLHDAAPVPLAGDQQLVRASARAAGVDEVATAVERSYRRRAGRQVRWPPLRWLGRLRPDPLRRLHLETPTSGATSLPEPTRAQEAAVRIAVHDLVDSSTTGLAEPWRSALATRTTDRLPALVDALDAAVAGTDIGAGRRPRWWAVWSVLGGLFFAAAAAGALWLGVLALLGYLQLPDPVTPMLGPLPWPTALLLGGVLVGLALAVAGRLCARVGARRAAARARRRLATTLAATVREVMVAPLAEDLARYRDYVAAVEAAARR